jgi:hypothetical protein
MPKVNLLVWEQSCPMFGYHCRLRQTISELRPLWRSPSAKRVSAPACVAARGAKASAQLPARGNALAVSERDPLTRVCPGLAGEPTSNLCASSRVTIVHCPCTIRSWGFVAPMTCLGLIDLQLTSFGLAAAPRCRSRCCLPEVNGGRKHDRQTAFSRNAEQRGDKWSCIACGTGARMRAASSNFCRRQPLILRLIIFARRIRSASASRAIARIMLSKANTKIMSLYLHLKRGLEWHE